MVSIWKSRQPFLTFRIIFTIMTVFFAVRCILSPLLLINVSFVMFFLSLLQAVQGIEKYFTGKRDHFTLTILTSVFLLGAGIYSFYVYLVSNQ